MHEKNKRHKKVLFNFLTDMCYYDEVGVEMIGPHPTRCMELSCGSYGKVIVKECVYTDFPNVDSNA